MKIKLEKGCRLCSRVLMIKVYTHVFYHHVFEPPKKTFYLRQESNVSRDLGLDFSILHLILSEFPYNIILIKNIVLNIIVHHSSLNFICNIKPLFMYDVFITWWWRWWCFYGICEIIISWLKYLCWCVISHMLSSVGFSLRLSNIRSRYFYFPGWLLSCKSC